MAEEKVETREFNLRQAFPWTELFRSFQVALDPKKLLLAAAGILAMSIGWWALAWAFRYDQPKADTNVMAGDTAEAQQARKDFQRDLANWKLMNEATGPNGKLSTLPWWEDRGRNPYKMVTGQGNEPWLDWLLTKQLPTLIEPLRKFLYPVIYLLHPDTGSWNRFYFLLVTLWTLAVWGLFGGAITRMASVQVARNEKVGMMEAVRFVWTRYLSFLSAPLFPLLFVVFVVVMLCVFGLFFMIPLVGDILVAGLGYPLVLLAGIAMAVVLVGLVGWPMMYATISAEGSDSFDAISRSYSYVYQSPWNYIWYALVALAYGAVVMFFVGFMGSLVVYLGKWGISATPFITMADRDPAFLYVFAPESFEWRSLLLEGAQVGGESVVQNGQVVQPVLDKYIGTLTWYNYVGAVLVGAWLYLTFLMVLGFGYSYFWSASTIIYLLMRRKVDDTDLDEVYLEEEDEADFGFTPPAPPSPTAITPAAPGVTMVDAPTLRTPAPAPATSEAKPPPPAAASEAAADKPASGDGAKPS